MTNNRALVFATVAVLLTGTLLSVQFHNFQWLSRFGALVICLGIITLARPAIRGRELYQDIILTSGYSQLDPRHYETEGEALPDWFEKDSQDRAAVKWLGPLLCLIGTSTNGFADLLTGLVWPK